MRPRKTIVCVDDDEQALSVRSFLLDIWGYRVVSVGDGPEALKLLGRLLPGTVDLLLTDLLMPSMDGNELARRAKKLHPEMPVMILSGVVSAFERALHADVFLSKGTGPAEMLEQIWTLVARKRGPKKKLLPPPGQRKMLKQRRWRDETTIDGRTDQWASRIRARVDP